MRKKLALFLVAAISALVAAGCTEGTQHDLKTVGKDIKEDVNEAGHDLNRKVEDALD